MFLRSKLTLVAATAVSATLALTTSGSTLASGAHTTAQSRTGASTYVLLTSGGTTLGLNPGTAKVLADNGISVAPASEARVRPNGIRFPIQGGVLNAKTLAGRVTHSGGLTFSAGGKDLTIRDFTINTSKRILTAYVDQVGARLTVLDLKLGKAKVTVTRKHLTVSNVKAVLNAGAASALNAYYGTSLFQGGLRIGTATVSAHSKIVKG